MLTAPLVQSCVHAVGCGSERLVRAGQAGCAGSRSKFSASCGLRLRAPESEFARARRSVLGFAPVPVRSTESAPVPVRSTGFVFAALRDLRSASEHSSHHVFVHVRVQPRHVLPAWPQFALPPKS